MPRKPRIDIAGLLYHVIMRGIERKKIFYTDHDREDFLLRLGKSIEGSETKIFAWSLMSNHVHLLLRTGRRPLHRIMRKLLTGYAVNFNLRYRRAGHLFQNRYKSIVCDEEIYLRELIRYIHLNPLRVKLVKNIEELNFFKWTGHPVILGKGNVEWQAVDEILSRFGETVNSARKNYLEFVKEGIQEGKREDLGGGGLIRSKGGIINVLGDRKSGIRETTDDRVLGCGKFVEDILKKIEHKQAFTDTISNKLDFPELLRKVSKYSGVTTVEITGKTKLRKVSRARAILSYLAISYLGMNGSVIGILLGISPSAVSQLYQKGEAIMNGLPLTEILNLT